MELVIGDKIWSSWSMRPWLVLKRTGTDFRETLVPLRRADTARAILAAGSPSGAVPFLRDGDLVVWDSLAICEHLAERFPEVALWPREARARALARCASAEMHAGFASLRGECAMDLALREHRDLTEPTRENLRRIVALWSDLRDQHAQIGPYLCGTWSIADAMFTPVATRLRSYGVQLSDFGDRGAAGAYAAQLLAEPDYLQWEREALGE